MTREQKMQRSVYARAHYWRNVKRKREESRCRKTRTLIDRARVEALRLLQGMVAV